MLLKVQCGPKAACQGIRDEGTVLRWSQHEGGWRQQLSTASMFYPPSLIIVPGGGFGLHMAAPAPDRSITLCFGNLLRTRDHPAPGAVAAATSSTGAALGCDAQQSEICGRHPTGAGGQIHQQHQGTSGRAFEPAEPQGPDLLRRDGDRAVPGLDGHRSAEQELLDGCRDPRMENIRKRADLQCLGTFEAFYRN